MADLSWKEAILRVLEQSTEALHYTEIAEAILDQHLRTQVGATPAQTVPGEGLYRTSTTDVLINAIRLIRPGTLPPNTNWGLSPLLLSPTYSAGHSFIGYLSADPSRTDILSDIEASLTALAETNPC